MPSPALIDISALTAPISEELSVGQDPREYSSEYYSQIKDARRAARSAERNNMFDGDNTEALDNWQIIITLAPKALKEEAKDLDVACWLTEALVRKAGFQGLRDGVTLIRELIENYWEAGLYPVEDEDGLETRVAPVAGLNGEGADGVLLSPIRNSFITEDLSVDPFSLWQYQQAVDFSRIQDEDTQEKRIEAAGFSMEDIEKAVAQSSDSYYADLADDINICIAEYTKINSLLVDFCGSYDAPPTSKIIELLGTAKSAIIHVAKYKLPSDEVAETTEEASGTSENTEATATGATSAKTVVVEKALYTREDAFKQLDTIAKYFKKNEPHSPISYMITRAIKWGEMPLDELMKELISDEDSRDKYTSLTGVKVERDEY